MNVFLLLSTALVSIVTSTSQAQTPPRLISPFDVKSARTQTSKTMAPVGSVKCSALVTPVIDFSISSRYDKSDATASAVDPALEEAYKEAVAPVQTFSSRVAKEADYFARSADANKAYANCALAHLYHWAKASALLGERNNVGYLVTSSALAAAASAYLKISSAYPSSTATETEMAKLKVVRSWFREHGASLKSHFETVSGKTALNNQRYTSGMAIGFIAIATQNHDLFSAAMKSLRVGLDQINSSYGYLPLELARGSRALSYHFVAVGPLTLLMEMASVNNVKISSADQAKMGRLVNFIYKSYKDPKGMLAYEPSLPEQETGFECNDFAYLEVHQHTVSKTRAPNSTLQNFLLRTRESCGDLYTSCFGGDLTYLFGQN